MTKLIHQATAVEPTVSSPTLSIIVPFYNEAAVIRQCLNRLDTLGPVLNFPYEIIFVDDGSDDDGAALLKQFLANEFCEIRIIRLSRNFGKEAAMTAGIDHARGEAVVIIDADLQDPPELIPEMITVWRNGADVVLMKRRSRPGEPLLKRLSSALFYRLLNLVSNHRLPEDVGDFRLLSRRAVDALKTLPERNRYMKGLFSWIGMRTQVIEYDRAPRMAGNSKWSLADLIKLGVEGVTSFSISPLHWSTVMGLIAACLGGLFGAWIVLKALILGDPVQGYPSLISVMTFLGGCQLLTIGILGEYVGKTYIESKNRPAYLVQDIINCRNA